MTQDTLSAVSLAMAEDAPDAFAERIGRSFADWGFAIVADHGIPAELIERAEAMSRAFFALPEDVKRSYHIAGGGGARGYTPFGTESAKGSDIQRSQGILAYRPRSAMPATRSNAICRPMSGHGNWTAFGRPTLRDVRRLRQGRGTDS